MGEQYSCAFIHNIEIVVSIPQKLQPTVPIGRIQHCLLAIIKLLFSVSAQLRAVEIVVPGQTLKFRTQMLIDYPNVFVTL